MRTQTLASQLRQAWLDSEWTLARLCERARLGCSADSLCRKLAGKQPLSTDEAEALSRALGRRLVFPVGRRGAAA